MERRLFSYADRTDSQLYKITAWHKTFNAKGTTGRINERLGGDFMDDHQYTQNDTFRDHLATIDDHGKRKWIFAQQPKGKFYKYRKVLSYFYFLLFFGLPFVQLHGLPFIMLNIPAGRFILFGKIFWPQDFFVLGLLMITFILFIILFTAAFGRLFCGWICPQTNFMEMLFRRVEYWVAGNANEQRVLAQSSWSPRKIRVVVLKHSLFFLLSFIIANFFLAYIIGLPGLVKIITDPLSEHLTGFMSLLFFSGVFYSVYAFFREQACTVVCPYGRLQSVLLDKNSMIVAYNYKRGEPRNKPAKVSIPDTGDCIDCLQCVKVCPTGIDIRNGVQMECVGCTACIDACDHVMEMTHKPKGLISYASENGIAEGTPLRYTSRMKVYTLLCVALLSLDSFLLISRKEVDTTVIRTPGLLYQERGKDSISNLYNLTAVNKTIDEVPITLKVESPAGGQVQLIGKPVVTVKGETQGAGTFFIVLPAKALLQQKTIVHLGIYTGTKKISSMTTAFIGPVPE